MIIFTKFTYKKIHALNITKKIKKRLEKSSQKISKSFQRRKRKNQKYGCEQSKFWQKMKNKSLLSIQTVSGNEKTPYCNYKKLLF